MTTGWFGQSWGAPVCEGRHVETPIGRLCLYCEEPIEAGDLGLMMIYGGGETPMHLDCQLRMILGGVNHQRGSCTCCGGTEAPDPPGLTRREAATAAAEYARRIGF